MTGAAAVKMANSSPFATIDEIIAEAKAGRPFIFVDDESRENEGDICVAAEHATPDIINFMIRECGGFVCLALDGESVDRLQLPLQPRRP